MKLQKHITLPAAVFLLKNKKKVNSDVTETCTRAQKDYFYKSIPDFLIQLAGSTHIFIFY
jgi:hypothetical protein